jgi:hypothetical protein
MPEPVAGPNARAVCRCRRRRGQQRDEGATHADDVGGVVPVPDEQDDADEQDVTNDASASTDGPPAELLTFARRVADEHQSRHGRPITRDALRARLGVSNQLASDLLRQIRTA